MAGINGTLPTNTSSKGEPHKMNRIDKKTGWAGSLRGRIGRINKKTEWAG
jgi:hypothetical protein